MLTVGDGAYTLHWQNPLGSHCDSMCVLSKELGKIRASQQIPPSDSFCLRTLVSPPHPP